MLGRVIIRKSDGRKNDANEARRDENERERKGEKMMLDARGRRTETEAEGCKL